MRPVTQATAAFSSKICAEFCLNRPEYDTSSPVMRQMCHTNRFIVRHFVSVSTDFSAGTVGTGFAVKENVPTETHKPLGTERKLI